MPKSFLHSFKKERNWIISVVIYEDLCFDVAQGQMNGHPMRLELTRLGLLV